MEAKNISKYKILPEMELILQVYRGQLLYSQIKKMKSEVCNHVLYSPHFNFIIDIRDAELNLSREELIDYANFVVKEIDPEVVVRVAVLSRTPDHVASTMVVQLNMKSKLVKYEAFSTVNASLDWLGLAMTRFNTMALDATISNMKDEPINQV